jgi:tRNA pseudouridine55 synthase
MSSGLLLIDKPSGWTSHDVVAKLRGALGTRRVGHAGTLDPMATGLLLIGVNSATKLLTFLVGEDKTYLATIRLGASTITDDKESEYLSVSDPAKISALTDAEIEKAIDSLRGNIQQVPSSVSAIKVNGERAYAKVRAGDEVKLSARPVTISKFEILGAPEKVNVAGHSFTDLQVEVDCSSGTYIRALARDLGEALGVGGHLIELKRTRIGKYSIEQAQPIALPEKENFKVLDISVAATQQFPVRVLSEQEAIDLHHGNRLKANAEDSEVFAGVDSKGKLIAMLTKVNNEVKSLVVFAEGKTND